VEADAADARVAAASPEEELPPLLGVPCTIKEIFAVAGLPQTAGVVARRGLRARSTAPIAQRLLDAGAIPLGLTNTAELAAFMETDNRVYGRTCNPYDPRRTAGGSSGGCGAAVASGGSPIGLATDGVSIRVPAFCCGVFGHRPSLGLVPLTGSFPAVGGGEVERVVRFGPIVRRAEDLAPVLRIIGQGVGEPGSVQLGGLRVVLAERCFVGRISRELLDARERAAAALERGDRAGLEAALHELRQATVRVHAAQADWAWGLL
jgi:fatty acid amide hydrolase 2